MSKAINIEARRLLGRELPPFMEDILKHARQDFTRIRHKIYHDIKEDGEPFITEEEARELRDMVISYEYREGQHGFNGHAGVGGKDV